MASKLMAPSFRESLHSLVHLLLAEVLHQPEHLHVLSLATLLPIRDSSSRRRVSNSSGNSHPARGAAWSNAPVLRSSSGR